MRGERERRGGGRLVLALAAVACALAVLAAIAAAEDTTSTSIFGRGGVATESLGTHFGETQFSSVEARPDGGLVAQRDGQLESYLANGAPDPAAPASRASYYRKVFPLAGGKSLVIGESRLTRVNADGSVDLSFGGTGTIKMPFQAQAAVELPSGRVLVANATSGGLHTFFHIVTVALVNQDGSIDQGLGTKGVLTLSLPFKHFGSSVVAIAPTGEGGALVVGSSFLLELRADGSPNPGFGSAGVVTDLPTLVGGRVLPDGSVEAVGSGPGPSGEDLLVLRYTAGGSPDLGFGAHGLRTFDLGGEEQAHTALWAADGSVVVGGSSAEAGSCGKGESCEEVPILAALDPGGSLDPGFGNGGVLRLSSLAGAPRTWPRAGVVALTPRPDGSIVAAGGAPPSRTVAFLAAFSPGGALLPGFGDGGIVRVRRPRPASPSIAGLARLANGKLLAAGTTDVGFDYAPVLIRYDADGGLDRSFGAGAGYVSLGGSHFARGFAVNASGQALVGVYEHPYSRLLLRAADGAPVPSFGSAGAIRLPRRVRVEALGFGKGGGAVVVGSHDVAGNGEPGVVLRFRPNGKPNSEFGHDGRVVLRTDGEEVRARALGAGGRGRMLVGGVAGRRFAMTRLFPDGRPDPRFGSGGWSLPRAGGVAKSVTLSRAGSRIYLAGVARDGDRLRVVLLRFDKDGRLDPTFGRHGRRTASISKSAQPKAIVPSRSGVLVVLGRGARPLLSFGRDGRVRRRWVGSRPQVVADVRAALAGGRLVLGWNAFSRALGREAYYLASRPLP
ncbi:MAG TPA: delta-60 repeat domain-containing protein [Solirubrobacterales bacterium]|nr:delta-60 repeat domain-containing protein [Solirubrobacterales bacterium]